MGHIKRDPYALDIDYLEVMLARGSGANRQALSPGGSQALGGRDSRLCSRNDPGPFRRIGDIDQGQIHQLRHRLASGSRVGLLDRLIDFAVIGHGIALQRLMTLFEDRRPADGRVYADGQ